MGQSEEVDAAAEAVVGFASVAANASATNKTDGCKIVTCLRIHSLSVCDLCFNFFSQHTILLYGKYMEIFCFEIKNFEL